MDGEQLPAQPIEPKGKSLLESFGIGGSKGKHTIFELFGVKKETSDHWWKLIKVFMVFGLIAYFCGIILDLFLGIGILEYALPLMVVVLLMWKFWGKDLLTKK